jgi:hypothetical protein
LFPFPRLKTSIQRSLGRGAKKGKKGTKTGYKIKKMRKIKEK